MSEKNWRDDFVKGDNAGLDVKIRRLKILDSFNDFVQLGLLMFGMYIVVQFIELFI